MAFTDRFKKKIAPKEQPEPQLLQEKTAELEQKKPTKKINRTRNINLAFRVTEEEKRLIDQKVTESRMSKTDFLIAAMENCNVVVLDDVPNLILQLRRQGNILNQAVKLAHQTQSTNLVELEEALQENKLMQKQLIDFLEKGNVLIQKRG